MSLALSRGIRHDGGIEGPLGAEMPDERRQPRGPCRRWKDVDRPSEEGRNEVDPAALGRTVRAVVDVSLGPGEVDEFESRLAGRAEVAFAAYVTGTADYTILVECEGPEGLDTFVRWLRSDAGVASTETKLLLRVVRD